MGGGGAPPPAGAWPCVDPAPKHIGAWPQLLSGARIRLWQGEGTLAGEVPDEGGACPHFALGVGLTPHSKEWTKMNNTYVQRGKETQAH